MFTRDDLIGWVLEQLADPVRLRRTASRQGLPAAGRMFLSEYEIRRRLTGDARELRIPKGSIVSPLAQDWLALRGVRVIEEDA